MRSYKDARTDWDEYENDMAHLSDGIVAEKYLNEYLDKLAYDLIDTGVYRNCRSAMRFAFKRLEHKPIPAMTFRRVEVSDEKKVPTPHIYDLMLTQPPDAIWYSSSATPKTTREILSGPWNLFVFGRQWYDDGKLWIGPVNTETRPAYYIYREANAIKCESCESMLEYAGAKAEVWVCEECLKDEKRYPDGWSYELGNLEDLHIAVPVETLRRWVASLDAVAYRIVISADIEDKVGKISTEINEVIRTRRTRTYA